MSTSFLCILIFIVLKSIPTRAQGTYFIAISRVELRTPWVLTLATVFLMLLFGNADGFTRAWHMDDPIDDLALQAFELTNASDDGAVWTNASNTPSEAQGRRLRSYSTSGTATTDQSVSTIPQYLYSRVDLAGEGTSSQSLDQSGAD